MRITAFVLLATACADEPAGMTVQSVEDVCKNATTARVWIIDGSYPERCPNRVHMVFSRYGTEHNDIKDLCVLPATTGIIKFSEEEAAMFSCVDDYGQRVRRDRNYD